MELFYSIDLGSKLRFVRADSCILELIQPQNYTGGRGEGVVAHKHFPDRPQRRIAGIV
jgi:hypothetical protein